MLTTPILTNQLSFEQLTFTADIKVNETRLSTQDNFTISLEMELFGCDNYDLKESKCLTWDDIHQNWEGLIVPIDRRPDKLNST